MELGAASCLHLLLGCLVLCLASSMSHESELTGATPQLDVTTPMTTLPVVNPYPVTPSTMTPLINPTSNPTPPVITTPVTSPAMPASGQSWCIASQAASQMAMQVALDYACGYGGTDCSAIQDGGSCYKPNTLRDHASYAFNDYYQKNPIPTSCNFGGAAVVTSIDPSNPSCQYPSMSTASTVLNTTNPTGATVFGLEPPSSNGAAFHTLTFPLIAAMALVNMMLVQSVFS